MKKYASFSLAVPKDKPCNPSQDPHIVFQSLQPFVILFVHSDTVIIKNCSELKAPVFNSHSIHPQHSV